MEKARLMNTPADFQELGVSPDQIEKWEDARRDNHEIGHWEWWYFDALLDDGSSVVIQFFPRQSSRTDEDQDSPHFKMTYVDKDGNKFDKDPQYAPQDATYGQDQCDVVFGKTNMFKGDLTDYHIVVDPTDDELGADISLHSLSQPYRPGSAYFKFGSDYYTWFCAVPRGEVSGTVTVKGETKKIHGFGYHDHQWGSKSFFAFWNNWTWARQSYKDYSLLVFDMITTEKYGYQRFPIAFVQDKNKKIVFQSTDKVDYQLLGKFYDEESGKEYPTGQIFNFVDGSKHLTYKLDENKLIENMNTKNMPAEITNATKKMGFDPSYTRYEATGKMTLSEPGQEDIKGTDDLIYEFMFPGLVPFDQAIEHSKKV